MERVTDELVGGEVAELPERARGAKRGYKGGVGAKENKEEIAKE